MSISPPPGGASVGGIEDVPGLQAALDAKVGDEELDEALAALDFPAPVIEQFVTNIAVNETFVTELVTNETYVTNLVTEIFEGDAADTYITQLTENTTYVDNTTTIINNNINGKKGQIDGLASLDADSKLTASQIPTKLTKRAISFVIDGGGSVITAGIKGDVEIPFAWTGIESVRMLADQSGSLVCEIMKDTYANFPPVSGDKITASAPPALSSAAKSQDTTLTGWTKTGSAGDILRFEVTGTPASVTRATISLVLVI